MSAYAVGGYEKAVTTLARQLDSEVQKRKVKLTRVVRQLWQLPPKTGTDSERVSQLQVMVATE